VELLGHYGEEGNPTEVCKLFSIDTGAGFGRTKITMN
jgi:hypothetical protein